MERLKQRQRNTNNRQRKSIVTICCEGKNETEEIYFKNYSNRNCIIKFSTGNSTDPVGMANDLVEFIKKEDINVNYGDKIYLLMDTDINENKQEQIDEAKKICRDNNIEIITSTPTFEFWYILHYGYTTKSYYNSKQVKAELKRKVSNYTEKMNIYPLIKNKVKDAIQNAKKIEKYQINNGKNIDSEEANPHTSVYRVVQELDKRNADIHSNDSNF